MPEAAKLRGSGFLKVVSIILIIFGAMSIVSGFSSIISRSMMSSMFGLDQAGIQYFTILGTISIVAGAIRLVFGVVGIKLRFDASKAGVLLVMGIIMAVIAAFSALYNYALAPMAEKVNQQIIDATMQMYGVSADNMIPNAALLGGDIAWTVAEFTLAALFIIGALLNRKPPEATPVYMSVSQEDGVPYSQRAENEAAADAEVPEEPDRQNGDADDNYGTKI
jgi:hypothetical protein